MSGMELRKQFDRRTFALAIFYLWFCFIKGVKCTSDSMCDVNAKCENGRCECKAGFSGNGFFCFSSPCYSAPCLNGGTCEKIENCKENAAEHEKYKCICPIGFTGNNCSLKVVPCNFPICDMSNRYTGGGHSGTCSKKVMNSCENDGKCSNELNPDGTLFAQKCQCLQGFTGDDCKTTKMTCASNPCQNGGTCVVINEKHSKPFHCTCTKEYIGVLCQERKFQSYLNYPRIHFAGLFQADTSTVNNIHKNYDTAHFDARQNEYGRNLGVWNPCGSGYFRIVNASVVRVCKKDGTCSEDDEMVGAKFIESSRTTTAAKLVDIDTDAQVASEIWALSIEIDNFLRGDFQRVSFQYMWGKMLGEKASVNVMHALGARYQSVLANVTFGSKASKGFAKELKEGIGKDQQLSIAFNIDFMDVDHLSRNYTYGRLVGSIGIAGRESYPYFNVGRMMKPLPQQNRFNNFQFILSKSKESDGSHRKMLVDLGNSLPIDKMGQISLKYNLAFGTISKGQELVCDNLDLTKESIFEPNSEKYIKWSGIYEITVPSTVNTTKSRFVIAGIDKDSKQCAVILAAEDEDGYNIHPKTRWLFRTEYDKEVNMKLFLTIYGEIPEEKKDVNLRIHHPDTKPKLGFPTKDLSFENGICEIQITPVDPANIRGYIDGQMYQFHYTYKNESLPNVDGLPALNIAIFILVWNKFTPPSTPNWVTHIRPIFLQYRNLYPVMRINFMDLGNYYDVVKHKKRISQTMQLDQNNANFMPVTRDLSPNKTEMIVNWLSQDPPPSGYDTSVVINMDTLKYLLQIAIQLEHATIPVYLNGYLSIKPGQNGEVSELLNDIVIQEMYHMAQACNLLNAFGGNPNLLNPNFIIPYPAYLPAGVLPHVEVTIDKLSLRQIEMVYMGIETPYHQVDEIGLIKFIDFLEKIAIGSNPGDAWKDFRQPVNQSVHHNTIGEVYQAILYVMHQLHNQSSLDFHSSVPQLEIGSVIQVHNFSDAVKAIKTIVSEGEGASACNPLMANNSKLLSHYFKFASIIRKRFAKAIPYTSNTTAGEKKDKKDGDLFNFSESMKCNGTYDYIGSPIPFYEGGVWPLVKSPRMSKYRPGSQVHHWASSFNVMYRGLLSCLQNVFNGNIHQFSDCTGQMKALVYYGRRLVQTPIEEGGDPDIGPNAAPTYTL